MNDDDLTEMKIPKFNKKFRTSVDIDPETDPETAKEAFKVEGGSSKGGRKLAWGFLLGGLILFLLGVTGVMDLNIGTDALSVKVINCTPGGLLCILAVFIFLFSKPKIKIKK